jgi:methionyl-tRNA formyltransferase
MRIAFAGTPEFAVAMLNGVLEGGHDVGLVLTQPDRPAGRGLKLQPSPVKRIAQRHGIPVVQPRSLRLDGKYPDDAHGARESLHAAQVDVMVVAAYGLLLPQWVLELPRLGCINVHASLLPRWRGAAPIQRAIEAGDATTGITIMQMDEGLDTGDILLARALPIGARDSAATLLERLSVLGAELIAAALADLSRGALERVPQPQEGVTYARKIDKAEAAIRWDQSADVIERRIRALDPFPGASTRLDTGLIKIWRAELAGPDGTAAAAGAAAGEIVALSPAGILVACGSGALRLTELQRSGGKRLAARDFLAGHQLLPGQRLEVATD